MLRISSIPSTRQSIFRELMSSIKRTLSRTSLYNVLRLHFYVAATIRLVPRLAANLQVATNVRHIRYIQISFAYVSPRVKLVINSIIFVPIKYRSLLVSVQRVKLARVSRETHENARRQCDIDDVGRVSLHQERFLEDNQLESRRVPQQTLAGHVAVYFGVVLEKHDLAGFYIVIWQGGQSIVILLLLLLFYLQKAVSSR